MKRHCLHTAVWAVMVSSAMLTSCHADDAATDAIPEGMARAHVTITAKNPTPGTRAVTGNWLSPTESVERIHDYRVIFVEDGTNKVMEMVTKTVEAKDGVEADQFEFLLKPGDYTVYGFANLTDDMWAATGITAPVHNANGEAATPGSLPADFAQRTIKTTNGWTANIPMTSPTGGQQVTVLPGENQPFAVEVVRTLAKLQFDFINNSAQPMDILGIEVFPLTQTDVPLLEPTDVNTGRDTVAYAHDLSKNPIHLQAGPTDGTDAEAVSTHFYVNESNATFTGVANQYSIRLKAIRYYANEAKTEEYRYGVTVNHANQGFTNIYRNDWIKIPLKFGDWLFRIEALQFVPIAGYQTTVVSADGLTATFLTGGNICIRPAVRRNTDPEGSWRNIGDGAVTFNFPGTFQGIGSKKTKTITNPGSGDTTTYDYYDRYEGLATDGTGIILTGDTYILTDNEESSLFSLVSSGDIVGQLQNNDYMQGKLTITLIVDLEGLRYSFTYNIVKALNLD